MPETGLKETSDLAKKMLGSGFTSVKNFIDKSYNTGKHKIDEILHSVEPEAEEIKDMAKEIKTSLSETIDSGTKEAIAFTLKNLPLGAKIKIIESLGKDYRDIEKLKETAPELATLVDYCISLCVDKSKLNHPKTNTIKELRALLDNLDKKHDLSMYPDEASIIGIKGNKGREKSVYFYLVSGNYDLKPLKISLQAKHLYR